jgi:hypothetical protein
LSHEASLHTDGKQPTGWTLSSCAVRCNAIPAGIFTQKRWIVLHGCNSAREWMCIVVYTTRLYHRLSQQHSVLGLSHIKSLGQSQHCATLAVKGLPIGSLQQFKVPWSSCCAGGQTTKPHEGKLPPSFHMHHRLFTVTSVVRSRSGTYPAICTMLCFRTTTSDMYGPIPLKHSRTRPKH